jgi:RNA polymerase sigma-70 factor (ECF subfamily)
MACSHCRRLGILESDAEDIVQEVLLTIHLKQGTWDRSKEIRPWLIAITRNKIIDAFRRQGRRIEVPIDDVIDSLQAEEKLPEFRAQDIDVLISKLTCKQQEILRSVSISGASIQETAGRLKMTEVAVRVSLHRALKALGALYRNSTGEN